MSVPRPGCASGGPVTVTAPGEYDVVIIVGERINRTRPANQQAVEAGDEPALRAGAAAAIIGGREACMMVPVLAARVPFVEDGGGTHDLAASRQGRLDLTPTPPVASPRA